MKKVTTIKSAYRYRGIYCAESSGFKDKTPIFYQSFYADRVVLIQSGSWLKAAGIAF